MKKIYLTFLMLTALTGYAQHECNTLVINDTEEQNGTFIIGNNGQKAAADIAIAPEQTITITHIKVTLASKLVPTFISFRFYSNIYSTPEDPEVAPGLIPGEALFDVTDTTVGEFEVIAYDEMHDFYIRNINVTLATPIVLSGSEVDGRFWMGVLSDANAWGSTAHYETGEGVVGESLAMGSTDGGWFQLINLEQLYELTAECSILANEEFQKNAVSVYPNPVKDILTINLPTGKDIKAIAVYSIAGQLMYESAANVSQIDTAQFADGVYILKTTSDNAVYNTKFIKQ